MGGGGTNLEGGGVHFWSSQICNNIKSGGGYTFGLVNIKWGGGTNLEGGVHFWSSQICNNIKWGGGYKPTGGGYTFGQLKYAII